MDPITIPIIGNIIDGAFKLIDKFVPDKSEAARMKHELLLLQADQQKQALDAAREESRGQVEINKLDAAGNWFQSGWRPMIGYVCGLGFLYQFIVYPSLQWYIAFKGVSVTPPPTLSEVLMELTLAMLGLGAARTFEKIAAAKRAA